MSAKCHPPSSFIREFHYLRTNLRNDKPNSNNSMSIFKIQHSKLMTFESIEELFLEVLIQTKFFAIREECCFRESLFGFLSKTWYEINKSSDLPERYDAPQNRSIAPQRALQEIHPG